MWISNHITITKDTNMIFMNLKLLISLIVCAHELKSVICLRFNWGFSALRADNDAEKKPYKIVCYYTNWAQYRPQSGSFFPENINPKLCTHIIFAFAKINDFHELQAFEWNDESTDWSVGIYNRTISLKNINKDLKVLLAVGG